MFRKSVYLILFLGMIILPIKAFPIEKKSAKPRMVEVEESVWRKKNEDLDKLSDEVLQLTSQLRIAEEEI
ncbi:MAG: hypothetical protein NC820_07930, partial [Candidatus Omnitrophica bacterium]|nr:hypothetical protein [Candidatus Omnitrophota bacterium]